jgi:hypothetical protein
MTARPAIPPAYLSGSGSAWAVIFQGMPLCPDGPLADATACAARFKLDVSGPRWDRETCTFTDGGN